MKESPFLMHTFRRQPVTFVKGRGATLWDERGHRFLDFFSGVGVVGLGHAPRAVAAAVSDQMRRLVHTSNIYFTQPQRHFSRELSRRAFPGRMFLSNSGAEANECAIKLARRYGFRTPVRGKPRHEIIVFKNSFHGRTLGTMAATGQARVRFGFGPLPVGFPQAQFGDAGSVKKKINPRTCAVLVEPIQGEGGVCITNPSFFKTLQTLCRRHRLLLIFDEVQTGMGRTGDLFAYQNPAVVQRGVTPDVLTVAKGLANGLPIGATLAKSPVADLMGPGDHGSTIGGGPVVCQAALTVLQRLGTKMLSRVRTLGRMFQKELNQWPQEMPYIHTVRGVGLMWGLELNQPGASVVRTCLENGLLVNCTAERVIRLLPPFCLTDREVKRGLGILKNSLRMLQK